MLEIKFSVSSHAEADRMARICDHIAAEFAAGDTETSAPASPPTTRPRGRPRKDPVQAYVEAGGKMPDLAPQPTPVTETAAATPQPEQPAPVVEQPEPAAVPQPEQPAAPSPEREQLLAKVRQIAIDKGSVWLRPLLQQHKAEKLSDLSDEVLSDTLATA